MGYRIAVAGATSNVGREILNILAEREFPTDEVVALAGRNSLGTEVSFGERTLKTRNIESFDFSGFDIALFATDAETSRKYAHTAAEQGCVVIDTSELKLFTCAICVMRCSHSSGTGPKKEHLRIAS